MKLLSLNVWGGRDYKDLSRFLERKKSDIDIFCFQETLDYSLGNPDQSAIEVKALHQPQSFDEVPNLYQKFESILDGFDGSLSEPYSSGMERLATFTKRSIDCNTETLPMYGKFWVETNGRQYAISSIMQLSHIKIGNKSYEIANFHGLWQNSSKADSPERIIQSQNILRALSKLQNPVILCGDFNLLPDTESIAVLEKSMKNLIKEYKITNTRSPLYTKEHRYADYIFVSRDIKVSDFRVLDDTVSDHLPLLLEFE
ncbi:MAG: endonuclease/exonuclease/phosphatase family protein [Candidatus Micrarchaeaceae archaeon]